MQASRQVGRRSGREGEATCARSCPASRRPQSSQVACPGRLLEPRRRTGRRSERDRPYIAARAGGPGSSPARCAEAAGRGHPAAAVSAAHISARQRRTLPEQPDGAHGGPPRRRARWRSPAPCRWGRWPRSRSSRRRQRLLLPTLVGRGANAAARGRAAGGERHRGDAAAARPAGGRPGARPGDRGRGVARCCSARLFDRSATTGDRPTLRRW
jgi:hypothetical protein